jgi:hypothetical protein
MREKERNKERGTRFFEQGSPAQDASEPGTGYKLVVSKNIQKEMMSFLKIFMYDLCPNSLWIKRCQSTSDTCISLTT